MASEDRVTDPAYDLLDIFTKRTKAELISHCRTALIRGVDLANLIMAADAELISLRHIPIFQHHHPEHLNLTERDLKTMSASKVGPMDEPTRKVFGKVTQMFEERRLFCAHMFWQPRLRGDWHLLYFDQRDISPAETHWEHGPHIHLMSWLTHPRSDPNALLDKLRGEVRPKLSGSIHIRYER